jgi:hypothetical protein
MALIVEDGTGKPNSDSYASVEDFVSYAVRYGLTVPESTVAQEALLRRAALSMDGLRWKGRRATSLQSLAWPRKDVIIDHEIKPSNYIPARIQYGQMALAAEIHTDDIDPIDQRKGAVILDRVEGAVTREYAPIASTSSRLLPAAPERPSRAQFADYLSKRGLFAVRA